MVLESDPTVVLAPAITSPHMHTEEAEYATPSSVIAGANDKEQSLACLARSTSGEGVMTGVEVMVGY